jgi:orotate phosphoribosyltransferase
MNNKEAVAEKLLQINAIKLSVSKPFTWASGWKSPIYCDNRKILSFPDIRDFVKSGICSLVSKKFENTDMLAGVATAGIAWAAIAADLLNLPFIYVRPKPKEHGLGNQIEGFIEKGRNVVIIEDLISTGKSSLQVAEILKTEELAVSGMVSIFNYGFNVANEAFEKAQIDYFSLTDYDTVINMAIEKKYISKEDQNTLLNWRNDPANWDAKS